MDGLAPVAGRLGPLRGDVAERQPDQFRRRLIGREMSAGLDDLPDARMDAFEDVGRVDHAPHVGRKREERNDVRPGLPPAFTMSRKPLAPRSRGECRPTRRPPRRPWRGVDRRSARASGFRSFQPTIETMANQMHETGLERRHRIRGLERFRHALEPIGHGDENVLAAAGPEVREDLQPELRAFGLLNPDAEDVARASGSMANARYTALLRTTLSSRILTRTHRRTRPDTSARAAASATRSPPRPPHPSPR